MVEVEAYFALHLIDLALDLYTKTNTKRVDKKQLVHYNGQLKMKNNKSKCIQLTYKSKTTYMLPILLIHYKIGGRHPSVLYKN
ncbi:hypothetical protein LguiB_013206 [Lonicera macranthoides]